MVLGIIATAAAVLAIPQCNALVFPEPTPTPTPLAFNPATDDETLIVIATFHVTTAHNSEPHVKIKRSIEEAASEAGLETLRVEIDPAELTADQREQAEALGKVYSASLVIWGEDTGVEVLVNFLNLKQPEFDAADVKISETERTQIANPSSYAQFVTADLPAQLSFLSLFAVGQSLYIQTRFAEA